MWIQAAIEGMLFYLFTIQLEVLLQNLQRIHGINKNYTTKKQYNNYFRK